MSSRVKFAVLALICIGIVVAGLIACEATELTEPVHRSGEGSVYVHVANPPVGYGVFRVYDPEMKVYCWIFEARGGIDCIPSRQLAVGKQ